MGRRCGLGIGIFKHSLGDFNVQLENHSSSYFNRLQIFQEPCEKADAGSVGLLLGPGMLHVLQVSGDTSDVGPQATL